MGVVDGGGGGVVEVGSFAGVTEASTGVNEGVVGVTEGVTEGSGVVEVGSAAGVTEVAAGVTEVAAGVNEGVLLVLWRRGCGVEPSSLTVMVL